MPCNLEGYHVVYLDGTCLREDPRGPLFRPIGRGTSWLTLTRSLPEGLTEKIGVRGVNQMLVGKKARGSVLYGIVLGLVLALPGCNANWPAIGSKEEQEALCRLPGHCAHSTPGGANNSGQ